MSVQTSYSDSLVIGYEGEVASSYKQMLKSGNTKEKIFFGRGLARYKDTLSEGFKTIAADKVSFDADFVASNTINGNVTIISVDADTGVQTETTTAISQVTYAASHASTLAAVVTAIEAISGVNAAGTASSGRTITVLGEAGKMIRLSGFVVAAGSSQAAVSYDTALGFKGISAQENKEPDSNGDVYYSAQDNLSIAKENEIFVAVDRAVTPRDIPYVRIVADSSTNQAIGQFTTSANASVALSLDGKAEFVGTTSGAGIVKLALLNV
jgi:hypothetical protein